MIAIVVVMASLILVLLWHYMIDIMHVMHVQIRLYNTIGGTRSGLVRGQYCVHRCG